MDIMIISSFLIILIMVIRKVFRNKVTSRMLYSIWLIPVLYFVVSWIMSFRQAGNLLLFLFYSKYMDIKTYITRMMNTVVLSANSTDLKLDEIGKFTGIEVTVWELLLIVWILGALVVAIFFAVKAIRIKKFLKINAVYDDKVISASERIVFVKNLPYPFLFGTRIYIGADERENPERLKHIISHEENHRKQGDVIWNLLRTICVIVFWFNPFVWIAAFLSKTDSEYACDEKTTNNMSVFEKKAYAMSLLEISTGYQVDKDKKRFLLSGISGGELKIRVKKILEGNAKRSFVAIGLCMTAVTFLLVEGILSFPHNAIELRSSELRKRANEYIKLPLSNEFEDVNVQYSDEAIYFTLKGDSQAVFEICDKWLEQEKEGEYYYVFQNNLQGNEYSSVRLWGVSTNSLENEKYYGTWISILSDKDNIDRRLFYTLPEDFERNYPSLLPGRYRMTYVVSKQGTNQKELIQVYFNIGNA